METLGNRTAREVLEPLRASEAKIGDRTIHRTVERKWESLRRAGPGLVPPRYAYVARRLQDTKPKGNVMDLSHLFLLAWTGLIFAVLGEIWLVQIVVYPLFGKVGEAEYVVYHKFYSSRIPLPVIVPGFASFLLTIPLIFLAPDSVPLWMLLANFACGVAGLIVTVALEIPRHARLEKGGKQVEVIRELIRYNWPRTLSITGSAFLTLLMLLSAFQPA
jgi:hypothetical protein